PTRSHPVHGFAPDFPVFVDAIARIRRYVPLWRNAPRFCSCPVRIPRNCDRAGSSAPGHSEFPGETLQVFSARSCARHLQLLSLPERPIHSSQKPGPFAYAAGNELSSSTAGEFSHLHRRSGKHGAELLSVRRANAAPVLLKAAIVPHLAMRRQER